MDKLDRLIADQQAEIDRLEKQAKELTERRDLLLVQLHAWKQAASLRPATENKQDGALSPTTDSESASANKPPIRRKGRQAGDISKQWQKALRSVSLLGRSASYDDFHKAMRAVGKGCGMPNVRGRVRSMIEAGFVSGNPREGFVVTDAAANRFGFKKKKEASPKISLGNASGNAI